MTPPPQERRGPDRARAKLPLHVRPDSVWPKPGEEAKSQVVQGGASGEEGPSAQTEKPEKGGKGDKPAKPKPAPKKHGAIRRAARRGSSLRSRRLDDTAQLPCSQTATRSGG